MGQAIPYDQRKQIVQLHQSGKSLRAIAESLPYSYDGVCKIWRRFKDKGWEGLEASYRNCGRKPVFGQSIKDLISAEKTGKQGAPYIRSILLEAHPDLRIPHERTIQRWWRKAGINRPRGKRPQKDHSWTRLTHHTWQIDGKEQVTLANGQDVCWINIADEATGTLLQSSVFPLQEALPDSTNGTQINDGSGF